MDSSVIVPTSSVTEASCEGSGAGSGSSLSEHAVNAKAVASNDTIREKSLKFFICNYEFKLKIRFPARIRSIHQTISTGFSFDKIRIFFS